MLGSGEQRNGRHRSDSSQLHRTKVDDKEFHQVKGGRVRGVGLKPQLAWTELTGLLWEGQNIKTELYSCY